MIGSFYNCVQRQERWMYVQANSRFRVPRTVEEESALVSEARPSSTKYNIHINIFSLTSATGKIRIFMQPGPENNILRKRKECKGL